MRRRLLLATVPTDRPSGERVGQGARQQDGRLACQPPLVVAAARRQRSDRARRRRLAVAALAQLLREALLGTGSHRAEYMADPGARPHRVPCDGWMVRDRRRRPQVGPVARQRTLGHVRAKPVDAAGPGVGVGHRRSRSRKHDSARASSVAHLVLRSWGTRLVRRAAREVDDARTHGADGGHGSFHAGRLPLVQYDGGDYAAAVSRRGIARLAVLAALMAARGGAAAPAVTAVPRLRRHGHSIDRCDLDGDAVPLRREHDQPDLGCGAAGRAGQPVRVDAERGRGNALPTVAGPRWVRRGRRVLPRAGQHDLSHWTRRVGGGVRAAARPVRVRRRTRLRHGEAGSATRSSRPLEGRRHPSRAAGTCTRSTRPAGSATSALIRVRAVRMRSPSLPRGSAVEPASSS